jgi:aubergine-like protein
MGGMSLDGQGEGGPRRRAEMRYIEPRTRPADCTNKRGTHGNPVQLVSNYFKLLSAPNWHLYQYHVDFSPQVDHKGLRMRLVKEHREMLGTTRAFDGMVLFLSRKLEQSQTEVTSQTREGENIRITFKLANELPPDSPTCIQMYNVILRRVLKMIDMQQIGRHYYNPSQGVTIKQHRLEVWPGFITSILQYEQDILLCAEISHKIMRTDCVLDILYDLYEEANRGRGPGFHELATKKLVGEIVLTRYNNKTYRVDDIDWDKNPKTTFPTHGGGEISFEEYYQKNYDKKIEDAQQPLLVSQPKKRDIRRGQDGPILLIPELCTLTGLSDDVRADFNVMKDLAVHTRVAPDQRCNTLNKLINTISSNPEVTQELAGWGLKFESTLINLTGRILPPEKILQRDSGYTYKPAEADWSREMRGQKLISCVNLTSWILLCTRRDGAKAQEFLSNLMRVGPPMGIQIRGPTICELPDENTQQYIRTIKERLDANTQLVMCILPSNRKDRYDAIKKVCCIQHPVPSQVVLGRTLSKQKMLMSVATKIAIQLNCKLGGEIWAVEIPMKGLMVVGMDTYHDSAKKGRSVGAFIATMNKHLTRYYSRCTFQHNMQELTDGLKVCMAASLQQYHQLNGALPERIAMYRDGVGDGQLAAVVEHEIPQLLESFKRVGADYLPKVTVTVVKKRINTRFFAKVRPNIQNPPPGTVVDTEVTKPEWYDFFLVSQSVRQGTVTPTHYNIVWDTMGLGPDKMQRFTYKLCHLYYNWPGTIRVPAPCQYAHKLAFLVGQSLHEDFDLSLADKLFFL